MIYTNCDINYNYITIRLQHPQGVCSPPVVETAIMLVLGDEKVDIAALTELKEVGISACICDCISMNTCTYM